MTATSGACMNNVLRFPSPDGSAESSFDVSDVVTEVCERLETTSFRRGIHLDLDAPPYTTLHGEREQFRQVVALLLGRIVELAPRGTDLAVTIYREPEGIELEVTEIETGIAHLLEAGRSAFDQEVAQQKRSRGLADLQHLIAKLGGELAVLAGSDGSMAITVHFPQHLQRAAA